MTYAKKEDQYKNQIFRWRKRKEEALEYLGGACKHCGYAEHPAALQFHHVDPATKDFSWNKLKLKSWDKIHKELDKCIILCANCHAIEHSVSKYD